MKPDHNTKWKLPCRCLQKAALLATVGLIAGLWLGCTKPDAELADGRQGTTGGPETAVARVNEKPLSIEALSDGFAGSGGSYGGMIETAVRSRLEHLITEEVLFQEASRRKLDRQPDIARKIRRLLAESLLERQVDRPVWSGEIGDAALKAYYDKHRQRFNRPAQVRLADIYLQVPRDADVAARDALRRKAAVILTAAGESRKKRPGFAALVHQYSDVHPGYSRGDTGFFDRSGKPPGLHPALVEAAYSIERVGQIYDGVVETPDGFHIVMLVARRDAVNKSFEDVRVTLEHRYRRELQEKQRQAFVSKLKEDADIRVDERAVAEYVAYLKKNRCVAVASNDTSHAPPLPSAVTRRSP